MMLGRPKQGAPLVATRPGTLDQVAPTAFEYGSQSPLAERIHEWGDMTLGYGLAVQAAQQDRKARYTLRADLSVGGFWMKGPAISQLTPASTDSTNGVVKFFEIGGVLYSVNGRYVHKRVNDASWTLEKDFTAGKAATDVVTFRISSSSTEYAYIAMGSGGTDYIWRFDGTTWAQHTTLLADRFALVGRDLYRSLDTNQLSKCDTDADPWTGANWTAANSFRIGDKTSAINCLAVTAQAQLLVFKTDGIYTLNSAGEDDPLYPFLDFAKSNDNGRFAGTFLNDIYTTYQGTHYRLKDDGGALKLEPIGPERLTENNTVVTGRVTAFAGVGGLFGIGAVYDDDNSQAHLLKFGSYLAPSIADGKLEQAQRMDVWHGSISQTFTTSGKKITQLYVSSIGASSAHTRTYIGFADGSLGWLPNPCKPNPATCSAYTFTTSDAEIYLPWWHGGFRADAKLLRSVTMAGSNLSSDLSAVFDYRVVAGSGSYEALATTFTTAPTQNVKFDTGTETTLLDVRVRLVTSAGAAGQSTQLTGVALHHSVKPALILLYEFDVLASYGLIRRDGSPLKLSANRIREALRDAYEDAGGTRFILPDESDQTLNVIDYGEAMSWDERLRGWAASIRVKAIQIKFNSTYGTIDRLAPYTVNDLAAFTIEQLGAL